MDSHFYPEGEKRVMRELLLIGFPESEHEKLSFIFSDSFQLIFKDTFSHNNNMLSPAAILFKVKACYSDFQLIEKANSLFIPIISIVEKRHVDYGMHLIGYGCFAVLFDDYTPVEISSKVLLAISSNSREGSAFNDSELQDLINTRLIGNSKNMLVLKENIKKIAHSSIPVFVHGESGTGKEVVARLLHDLHPARKKYRFVARNCSSIPKTLFESELFGSEKGAYTGAETRPGSFEVAHNGTLFLDEIRELAKINQPKLLRVLEEKAILRLGSINECKVDVRLVSASHKDLKKGVSKNKFRLDLYYRLAAVKLHIPPLRQRLDDIPMLIRFFMSRHASPKLVPDGVIDKLSNYDWPGNIRQLINVLERAILFSGKRDYITAESVFFY